MTQRLFTLTLATALLAGCAAAPPLNQHRAAPAPESTEIVEVGIIAFNDFHGNLEPPRRAVGMPGPDGETVAVPAGGAAWFAAALDQLRARYRHHLTVSAGDLTGASQLASSLFLDEPTIGVMNRVGLEFNAVGNHEFDRGWRELKRLQDGGCEQLAQRKPCAVEAEFAGAQFNYLAANVDFTDGTPLFPGSALRHFGEGANRVAIGLIGLTLEGTPTLVTPAGIEGISFGDEAEAINSATDMLKRAGADAVIVLIHEGAVTGGEPDPNSCVDPEGALVPILEALDQRVDMVLSGHTHRSYVCDWQSADGSRQFLLTSAGSYGTLLTDITLAIDPAGGGVVNKTAVNIPVQSEPFRDIAATNVTTAFAPRQDVAEYVATYVAAAAEFATRPAGKLASRAVKSGPAGGPLGNLIADAQLNASLDAGAQIAFMNPGGIRADIEPQADGQILFGDIYRAQPFDNTLITMTLSGAQVKALLENQFEREHQPVMLAVSDGFTYTADLNRPAGGRISGILLNGEMLDMAQDYRVTVNSFLATGGDGFALLNEGRDRTVGMSDLAALEAWLQADPPRSAPDVQRIKGLSPQD